MVCWAISCRGYLLRSFSEWILDVGDGKLSEPNDGEALIYILEEFLILNANEPIEAISKAF